MSQNPLNRLQPTSAKKLPDPKVHISQQINKREVDWPTYIFFCLFIAVLGLIFWLAWNHDATVDRTVSDYRQCLERHFTSADGVLVVTANAIYFCEQEARK